MFPSLFGDVRAWAGRCRSRPLRGDPRRVAARSPTAASSPGASSAARSWRPSPSGSSPPGPPRCAASAAILFDGRPAEIHPYDVTVEREDAAEAWDCKWGARGIKADVLHQLDDARRARGRGRDAPGRRAGRVRRAAVVRGPPRPRARAGGARGPAADRARVAGPPGRTATRMTDDARGAANRTATVPYRVRFDECGPDGLARTSALLRYAQDVAWIHSERLGFDRDWYAARGLTWLVRAAEVAILRAGPAGHDARRVHDGRRLPEGLGAPPDRRPPGRRDAGVLGAHGLGHRRRPRRARRASRPSSPRSTARCRAVRARPGAAAADAGRRDDPRDRRAARRTSTRSATSTTPRTSTTSRRRCSRRAMPARRRSRRSPRSVRLEYLLPAAAGVAVDGAAWQVGDGSDATAWAWRLVDRSGTDLARGRLGPGTFEPIDADRSGG